MRRKYLLILSVLAFSLPFLGCMDKTIYAYYINPETGNDKNPGTLKKPIKTITELNNRFRSKPVNIFFAAGHEYEGTLIMNNVDAFDSIPVIVGNYGEGKATIFGRNNEAIRIVNCRNIRINNLNLKGSGRKEGNTANGLQMINSSCCRIEDIYAEGFQKSGVDLYNCRNIKVLKVTAHGNGFCGINIMGSRQDSSGNILIKDCMAENNPGDPTRLDNHSGNGILVGVSDSVIIDHCTATNNGWDMPRQGNGPVGIWAWMSNRVTIQYCISYRNKTSKGGKDGGGFDFDGGMTNSLIQYCLSYENQGAGYGLFQYQGASDWSNNVIRYSVSINDALTTEGAGSFFIWNGSDESKQLTNCYIYNNVVYSSFAPAICFENNSIHENFLFTNNIFLGANEIISGRNTGSRFLGNIWWSTSNKIKFTGYSSLAEWAKATGQEILNGRIVGIQTDPKLQGPYVTEITDPYKLGELAGYILKADSPIKDSGREIDSIYGFSPPEKDFYGNPIPHGKAVDPGIYEFY